MADKIKIRRGLFQNLPDLDQGEFGYSTDTGTVYLGTSGTDNILINPVQYVGDGYYLDGYLIPTTDNVHDLGTAENRWHSVYVGPGTINIVSKDTDSGHTENKEFNIGIDPDTGKLQFTSDDNVLMELDSTGNVSIPSLDIGNTTAQVQTIMEELDAYASVFDTGATGDGYVVFFTGVGRNLAGDNDFRYNRETGALTVDGYVGLGTSTPINRLEVFGSAVVGTNLAGVQAPCDGLRVQGDLRLDSMQQYASAYRTLLSTTTNPGEFNAFGSTNGGTVTVLASSGILFTTTNGFATITKTGVYHISTHLLLSSSTDGQLDSISFTVDNATVWTARPFLRGSTTPIDPQLYSGSIIYGLDAGDIVECRVNSFSGNTVTVEAGSTFNIMRIA